jgi:hypothetical protein
MRGHWQPLGQWRIQPEKHYSREEHHWRFKTPLHWRILNRHNQLGSDELITSLPVMPNRQ